MGLVGALTAHYGSPGRLADYRRQCESTIRTAGEDPSIFATALETLAIKAFGDMGQTARLRIIRIVAEHDSCELCRHLYSVPPETMISKPGPDRALPTYMVSDCRGRTEDRMVAAVATSKSTPDQFETLLRRLLAGTTSEAGALYYGTVVTVLVSGSSDSKACPGHDDPEF